MSNIEDLRLKQFPIELDRTRYLVFDLNTFVDIEDKYGTVGEAMNKLREGKMRNVREILYMGLKTDDPELTEEAVGSLVLIVDLEKITGELLKSIGMSLPQDDENEEETLVADATKKK